MSTRQHNFLGVHLAESGNGPTVARIKSSHRRLVTAALWPFGIALTAWHYMWRTTPMHRSELAGSREDLPPPLPEGFRRDRLQQPSDGVGPLFHRRYEARVREPRLTPEALIELLGRDPNTASPTELARFHKLRGGEDRLRPNDELLVQMPGPWNGPVRVVEVTATSFRYATLDGHLEAGQIAFSACADGDDLRFRVESWARSGDRLSNLLHNHLRMAKEVQLHMWSSFIEQVAEVAGGRLTGGIVIETRRLDQPDAVA
jgi:uncharacterized protein DUF1990